MNRFRDRHDAGRQLVDALDFLQGQKDVIVLAIPRGGVVVGYEVAAGLNCPLDVFLVRKIGVPSNPELAMGAIASDGTLYLDRDLIAQLRIPESYVEQERERQQAEIERRLTAYRSDCPSLDIDGKQVVLVDDGVATGSTLEVALRSLRKHEIGSLILAVPVAAPSAFFRLSRYADHAVCLRTPELFWAVGSFYDSFEQTTDEEVVALLADARRREPGG
jgi:predicted phosphoribosyltransferase